MMRSDNDDETVFQPSSIAAVAAHKARARQQMSDLRSPPHSLCIWALLLLTSNPAFAASFDCKVAKTPEEHAICASPSLSKLDEELAAAYTSQLAAAPKSLHTDLRSDELSFLQMVATSCSPRNELTKIASCMEPQYESRIAALKKPSVSMSGQTFINRTLTLLGKNIEDTSMGDEVNPGYGTLTATWPQSTSGAPEWIAWNAATTRAVQAVANPESTGAKPIVAKAIAWKPRWAADSEMGIEAKLMLVTESLVSERIESDSMGHGAAHPNENWIYFHWLLAQRRELTQMDIFKEGVDWRSLLAAKCLAALQRQNATKDFLYDPAQVAGGIADALSTPRNWAIGSAGLTIVFPEYSVSPRSMPANDVLVPWKELASYLAVGFAPPR